MPGIGSDSQAVVNEQVEDKYDIYVGMLGPRFGTPTARAGSGTEEEFEAAYERWKKSPENVRILCYFKNTSDTALQDLDLTQLAKVQEFRKRIAAEVLYSDFKTTDDFLKQVREHLWRLVADQWDQDKWKISPTLQQPVPRPPLAARIAPQLAVIELQSTASPISEPSDEDDAADSVGILDALVEAQESIQAGFAALGRITSATVENNRNLEQHAQEIAAINTGNSVNPKQLKSAVNAAADDISSYARSLRAETPAFVASFTAAFEFLEISLAGWIEEGRPRRDEILDIRRKLEEAVTAIRSSRDPVAKFRDTISKIPGLTSRLKKAVRSTKAQLDELIAGITVVSDRADSLLRRLNEATGEDNSTRR